MEKCYLSIFNSKASNNHHRHLDHYRFQNPQHHNYRYNRHHHYNSNHKKPFNCNYNHNIRTNKNRIISKNQRINNSRYRPRYMDHLYCHNVSLSGKASSTSGGVGVSTENDAKTEIDSNSPKTNENHYYRQQYQQNQQNQQHQQQQQQQQQRRQNNQQQILSTVIKENKQLKTMIIFHLDLIQEQNNQLLAKDKILLAQIDELERLTSRNSYLENHVRELQRQLQQQIKRSGEISSLPPPPLAKIQCKITTTSHASVTNVTVSTVFTSSTSTNYSIAGSTSGITSTVSSATVQGCLVSQSTNYTNQSNTPNSFSLLHTANSCSSISSGGGDQPLSEIVVSNPKPNIIGECNGKLIRKIILQRVGAPIKNLTLLNAVRNQKLDEDQSSIKSQNTDDTEIYQSHEVEEEDDEEEDEDDDDVDAEDEEEGDVGEDEEEKEYFYNEEVDNEDNDDERVTHNPIYQIEEEQTESSICTDLNNSKNSKQSKVVKEDTLSLKPIAVSSSSDQPNEDKHHIEQGEDTGNSTEDSNEILAVRSKRLKLRQAMKISLSNTHQIDTIKSSESPTNESCESTSNNNIVSTIGDPKDEDSYQLMNSKTSPLNSTTTLTVSSVGVLPSRGKQMPLVNWQTSELQTDESAASGESSMDNTTQSGLTTTDIDLNLLKNDGLVKLLKTTTIASTILTTSTTTLPSPSICGSIETQTCNISNVINLDEIRIDNSSPGLQQSPTKIKRYSYLTTPDCYLAREWEDELFAIQNDSEFIKAEAKELSCDMPNLEIPKWTEHELTPSYCIEGTEDLSDESFMKRHLKLEVDEKRRKKWDVQQIREQRRIERLKRRHCKEEVNLNNTDATQLNSFYPMPDDVQSIHYTDELPVQAFGELIPRLNYGINSEEQEFSLPWKMKRTKSTTDINSSSSFGKFASSDASNLTSLPEYPMPPLINIDTNSPHSSVYQNSTFIFLKRKKRRQSSSNIVNNINLMSTGCNNSNNNKNSGSGLPNNANQVGRHQRSVQTNRTMSESISSPTISTQDTEIDNVISNSIPKSLATESNLMIVTIKKIDDTVDETDCGANEEENTTVLTNSQINDNTNLEERALSTIKKENITSVEKEEKSTNDEKPK